MWCKFHMCLFLAHQILGIVGSQSDIESIFNVVGLITNLHNLSWRLKIWITWYSLQKNWLVDACVGCALNPKNMIDILASNNIMIEDNKRLMENKQFFKRTLIHFEGLLVFFVLTLCCFYCLFFLLCFFCYVFLSWLLFVGV